MTHFTPKNSSQPSGTASSTSTSGHPTTHSTSSSLPTVLSTSAPDSPILPNTTITPNKNTSMNEPTTADLFTMENIGRTLTAFESHFETRLQNIETLQHQYMNTNNNPIGPSGFHQRESKDFHISHLNKLLANEVIAGDSLQDLKLFYDAILSHFNTVALTDTLFPNYRDLTTDFNFQDHLCPPTLPSGDLSQSIANYRSFGNSLHQFLLDPKTIPSTTCPDSAIQLLSLCNTLDGFLILQEFVFLLGPQLQGDFRNYSKDIATISIHEGERLQAYYSCVMWLFNEITLAQQHDGMLAALLERFLTLLQSTGCSIIISETSTCWKQITSHHKIPKHTTIQIPWSITDVLRSLETVGITNLTFSTKNSMSITNHHDPSPSSIPAIAAYTHYQHHNSIGSSTNDTSDDHFMIPILTI
jgi:hypothetical protein